MVQKRFVRRGVAKVFYLPAVADPAVGPTRAEVEAGLDVTDWLSEISGFAVNSGTIPTPDMGNRFTSTIPGETTVDDSTLTFWDDELTEDIEDAFPIDDIGFVYFMRKGDKPASPTGDLFPTRVASRAANWTTDMAGATVAVTFSITAPPSLDTAIPAAAGGGA